MTFVEFTGGIWSLPNKWRCIVVKEMIVGLEEAHHALWPDDPETGKLGPPVDGTYIKVAGPAGATTDILVWEDIDEVQRRLKEAK